MSEGHKSPGVTFRSLVERARRKLHAVAVAETLVAGGVGAAVALGLALLLVGLLPFSLGLRATLWGLIGVGALSGLAVLAWRRLLPLRKEQVVAARLEEAAARRGARLSDAVRGAVELLDDGEDESLGRSRALCDAHIRETTQRLEQAGALASVGGVGLGLAVPTLLAAALVMGLAGLVLLVFPQALEARLQQLFDDHAAEEALRARAASLLPLVTDLKLTLRFPAYMGRDDQVIPGSSGDVVAPRGTEIFLEGRADRAVKAAALLLGEREVALEVAGGRTLKGRFLVDAQGSYRFRLTEPDGDTELDPVAHRVTLSPDEVPKVSLEEPAEDAVVRLEDEVPLRFSASDDYGITRVRLVVRRQGSGRPPFEKDLMSPESALRELKGGGSFTVEETGARPGDRLSVYVEALDNDTVGGPQAGRSETRVLTVFSAKEHHRKLIELEEKLLDRMVHVLGDELEAPIDGGAHKRPAEEQRRLIERHGQIDEGGREMLALLDEVLKVLAEDQLSPEEVRRALANMRAELTLPMRNKRELTKGTRVSLDKGRSVLAYVFRHLESYQRDVVGKLEHHVLYLEDLLNTQRLAEARQIAEDLKRTQKDLQELLDQYKKEPSDEARQALLEEIEQLREQMRELMRRLAELQREVPDEYLNQEAFDQQQMMSDAMDLDRLIEEGKLDEAAEMLQKMVEQTQKLMEELEQSGEEYGGEEYQELREKLERFGQELSALEAKQEELLHRNERMLEAAKKQAEKQLQGKLEEKLKELEAKVEQANASLKQIDPTGLFAMEQEDAAFAQARVDDLKSALEQGDLEDALQAAGEAMAAARSVERSVADRTRGRFGTRNKSTLDAKDRLQKARPLVEDVYDELNELMPDPSQLLSKEQRAELRKDAEQQGQLKEQADRVAEQMAEIGKELPIFGPSHKEQLQRAGQKMRQAGRELGRDGLRDARASQQQALQGLQDLREALSEMGQGSGSGGLPLPLPGGGSPGSERSGNGRRRSQEKVKIPGADEFRVPDAFRKDILDAMREGAPEEWQGEVKRYYEELVK